MKWYNINFFYADHFEVPLKENHRFPMEKYKMLREMLIQREIIQKEQCIASKIMTKDLLYLAHEKSYVDSVLNLSLEKKDSRPIGLPLSREMVNRTLASAQAYTNAVNESLNTGYSASFAGGTHHAHSNKGEGFCFFNDFAINVRRFQKIYPLKKILILDLDVHQGNGNSSILKNDPNVFIVSFHGKHNYPYRKVQSHLDIDFENDTKDDEYLSILSKTISKLKRMNFDHIFYQAGVDSLKTDSFGKLALSLDGLVQRDTMVFNWAFKERIPLASAIGGGYSHNITDTVNAYVNTFTVAKNIYNSIVD
jgi:acetoin utilization deacetylase AcuC-like enzyme